MSATTVRVIALLCGALVVILFAFTRPTREMPRRDHETQTPQASPTPARPEAAAGSARLELVPQGAAGPAPRSTP